MNVKKLLKLGNIISFWSVTLIPILWIGLNYFDILLVSILWFTFYTWLYIISWYAVVFVIIIRPLSDLFPQYKSLRQLALLRRAFGILSAMIIVTFLFDKWIGSPSSFLSFFTPSDWSWGYPLIARLSEVTAIILLLTSNNFSQKRLGKNWKRIQRSSYIYFISWWILAMRYGDDYGVQITMILVIWVFLTAEVMKRIRRRKSLKEAPEKTSN